MPRKAAEGAVVLHTTARRDCCPNHSRRRSHQYRSQQHRMEHRVVFRLQNADRGQDNSFPVHLICCVVSTMLIQVCAQLRAHARARLRLSSAMPWARQHVQIVPSSVFSRCMYPCEGYACPHLPKKFVWIPSPWLLFQFNSPRASPFHNFLTQGVSQCWRCQVGPYGTSTYS